MRPTTAACFALALTVTAPVARAQTLASAARPRVATAAAEPDLTAVRLATARFRDVRVAVAEGYVRDPGNLCDTAKMMGRPASLGAIGIHYFRPDLLGITKPPAPRVVGTGTHTDFARPPFSSTSRSPTVCWSRSRSRTWCSAARGTPPGTATSHCSTACRTM